MRATLFAILLTCLTAPHASAGETYDLVFKGETLSEFSAGHTITYSRETLDLAQEVNEREKSTTLELAIQADGQAELQQQIGERLARILSADASVGNPMAMFFMESTVREVARLTGGSVFYIRNRFKDSLVAENPVEQIELTHGDGQITASKVTLTPFADDKNRARMGPFADLTMRFVVSESVPGWYHSLTAEAPLPGTDTHVYRDEISIESE